MESLKEEKLELNDTLKKHFICFVIQKKCEQYWPDSVGGSLSVSNGLTIVLESSLKFADYNIQTMKLTRNKVHNNYCENYFA